MLTKEQKLEEFNKFLQKSKKEETNKIYYILDYALNHKYGYRVSSELGLIGLTYLLDELIKIEIIKKVQETDYRSNVTNSIEIFEDVKEDMKKLLESKYYPNFKDESIREILTKLIEKNFPQALHIYSQIKEYNPKSTSLEQTELATDISKESLGYLVGYTFSRGKFKGYELVFRSIPIKVQTIFFDIVSDELQSKITEFNPSKRWAIYLKSINPNAPLNFYLMNKNGFSPREVEEAFNSIQGLDLTDKMIKDLIPPIIIDVEDMLKQKLNFLIKKDLRYSTVFSSLLNIGQTDTNLKSIKISKSNFDNFMNLVSYDSRDKLKIYINDLIVYGIIYQTESSDLIIPELVQTIFESINLGIYTEFKVFDSEIDAKSFIADLFSKIAKNAKIIDSYFSIESLNRIEFAVRNFEKSIQVNFLTSSINYPSELDHDLANLKEKGVDIRIKSINKILDKKLKSPFHDRFIIIDDEEVWQLGTSINFMGGKFGTAIKLKSEWGKIILKNFESWWSTNPSESWKIEEFPKGGSAKK